MKKIITLLLATIITLSAFAQPQQLNFQGVARNASGALLPNQNISVRLTVRDLTAAGTSLYSETRAVTTNAQALFVIAINSAGAANVSGNFTTVNWAGGAKFLQVEVDPAGGSSFLNLGATELLSVPYALTAGNANSANIAGGTGVVNTIPKFNGANTLINSQLFENGTNIGIGKTNPAFKLDVNGSINTSSNLYANLIGVGTTSPAYRFHIYDGLLGFTNTTDSKTWTLGYSTGTNTLRFQEEGITRMSIENGGNVGIGTSTAAYKLDVQGTIRTSTNIIADGNGTIEGSLTVNNNKGVAFNASSSTNLRIYPFTTGTFTVNLPAHGSIEGTFGFDGGFTSEPRVFVGSIFSWGGPSGEPNRVIMVVHGCTYNSTSGNTRCQAKLINTDGSAVNYSIRWNMLAIGN
jgi:hypothetical protein